MEKLGVRPWPVGALSYKPKGGDFDSWSKHMPRSQAWSPLGAGLGGNRSMFLSHLSLSPSPPLSLRLKGYTLTWELKIIIIIIINLVVRWLSKPSDWNFNGEKYWNFWNSAVDSLLPLPSPQAPLHRQSNLLAACKYFLSTYEMSGAVLVSGHAASSGQRSTSSHDPCVLGGRVRWSK